MSIYLKTAPKAPTPKPSNPTDSQRHEMFYSALAEAGRPEDYKNIIRLLSPPPGTPGLPPGEFNDIKVGIIGGGLAGMSAAFELRKMGFDITIFEPNTERIGGRVYTYYFDRDRTLYGEFGAMRIPISHETTWHYINLFKLNTAPFINVDPNTFTYVRDIRVRNDPKGENIFHRIYPLFDLTKAEADIPWSRIYTQVSKYYMSTLPPEIRKQLIMVMPGYDYRFEFIMGMSIRDALKRYGLSDEAINLIVSLIPIVGSAIESSYSTTLSDDYTMDFLNLYRITGGMANLPLAFFKSLTSINPEDYPVMPGNIPGKVNWMGGYSVYGIYKSDTDGKVVLRYGLFPGPGDLFKTFDYVICALPMALLRLMDIQPIFSGRKMEAIRAISYYDAQKTLFLCKERFWESQGILGGISSTDRVAGMMAYPSGRTAYSPHEPGVLLASYNLGQDAVRIGNTSPQNQYRFIREDVERVHGLPNGYLNNIVEDSKTVDWQREIWAKGAFQMLLPGQKTDFLYVSSTPEYDNRVFFAGEHASAKNAWMQGALHSGMKAANDVAFYSVIHKYQK